MVKVKWTDIAKQLGRDGTKEEQEVWQILQNSDFQIEQGGLFSVASIIADSEEEIINYVKGKFDEKEAEIAAKIAWENRPEEEKLQYEKDIASIMVTSGYNFEGYKISRYSGYISGDDAISVDRGFDGLFSTGGGTGEKLLKSLSHIRQKAIRELKEAAYDLDCNAVIGVDFDYITLDPQTANSTGGTTYYPYIFCVTANGTAVQIEKE